MLGLTKDEIGAEEYGTGGIGGEEVLESNGGVGKDVELVGSGHLTYLQEVEYHYRASHVDLSKLHYRE